MNTLANELEAAEHDVAWLRFLLNGARREARFRHFLDRNGNPSEALVADALRQLGRTQRMLKAASKHWGPETKKTGRPRKVA